MSVQSRRRLFYEGYRPTTFEQFPGLDLKSAPDQSGCVDMLNCDITLDGNLSSRMGSSIFSTADTNALVGVVALFNLVGGNMVVVSYDSTNNITYQSMNAAGALGAAYISFGGDGYVSATRLGAPSGTFLYATNGLAANAPGPMVKFDGTTFTQPTVTVDGVAGKASPRGRFLATSPIDNRLVVAGTISTTTGPNAAASSGSHVWFSEPGLPESYLSTSFVQLTPGDGESIQGAVAWREFVFVFKESRFFVFYGTSTDSTGKPIFNYRAVDTGVGLERFVGSSPAMLSCCAGSDGVYFANTRGIYKTTGGAPVLISRPLDPLFQGGASAFWQGGVVTGAQPAVLSLTWFNERLYVVLGTSVATARNLMLVYDPRQGVDRWLAWLVGTTGTLGILAPTAWATASMGPQSLYFGVGRRVRVFSSAATDDAGTAITSRYRSGFGFGGPDQTVIRETILDGSGAPTLQWSRDWGSLVTGSAVTLGTAPAIAVGRQRIAIRGRRFSWQLGATNLSSNITNPLTSTSAGTIGWTPTTHFNNAGAVLTSVTTPAPQYGNGAMRVVTDGALTAEGAEFDLAAAGTFLSGQPYTFAVWLRGNAGGETMGLILGIAADLAFGAITLTTAWVRYSVTWTPNANRTGVGAAIQRNAAPAATFFVNAAMQVTGSTPPAFDAAVWSLQRLEAQQRDLRESSITG